ncbi:MBL fold metallo-hydrolase [Chryseobacterium sp. SSA4.19]|uniref:MBL fold metallo-hydrolase n=1 Tax=Chryseobacterium sp. SSA4.19 TaxID=2919915 RepID=UPI001F4E0146|nr:MBL fold metallo-hydrolase [Chryseobacterium sp. SSA4.19]MCJ8153206.1 MBL fold metallo-hydrolase [Chryseobacterium sp. SSA4.19]
MKLKVIGSGSKGNAYLLENEEEALLIECGVNIMEIKKAVDFKVNKITACLITHEHGDHAQSILEVIKAGINVYATSGTFQNSAAKTANSARMKVIPQKGQFKVGNFNLISFPTIHDVAEPCGFLINHKDCGTVLFLTDTVYCPYTFKGLNNIIIEANYDADIINEKLGDKKFLRDRVYNSHMSIETCMDFLLANDLSQVNNIVLIHLSDSNSHEINFAKKVSGITGKEVHTANGGMIININKTPF